MAIIFDENGLPTGRKVGGGHYRVLIVDDSQFVIKHLSQIFMSRDFEIAGTATNGREGVELYKQLYPNVDLVTLDITMPEMDGIEALKEIKAIDPNATVVMVTAIGTAEAVKEAIKLGAKGYLVKPIDREKVIERLAQILK
ncbi:response regulator [Thermospira aquatica]|uniref:Response regulator n=1 Tax=Thermospira aquatica TaxID=2828656 RepID=A0AAX3BB81_9SPIR|nr:response regulator [Thermospira aquatica]URA09520.1 response regulator [Thermospira aquatica]